MNPRSKFYDFRLVKASAGRANLAVYESDEPEFGSALMATGVDPSAFVGTFVDPPSGYDFLA